VDAEAAELQDALEAVQGGLGAADADGAARTFFYEHVGALSGEYGMG
jgi:hypothetical protein